MGILKRKSFLVLFFVGMLLIFNSCSPTAFLGTILGTILYTVILCFLFGWIPVVGPLIVIGLFFAVIFPLTIKEGGKSCSVSSFHSTSHTIKVDEQPQLKHDLKLTDGGD